MWRSDTASAIGPSAPARLGSGGARPAFHALPERAKEGASAARIFSAVPSMVTVSGCPAANCGCPASRSVKPSSPAVVTAIVFRAVKAASIRASVPGVSASNSTQ